MDIWEGGNWTGFLLPKTDVLGWWLLWPETVNLLMEWRLICREILGREVKPDDRVIIKSTGHSHYNDASKNSQSEFANSFNALKSKCNRIGMPISDLPLGTLRNQFSDWCGGDEGQATIASVALAHGIPHKGDKLLYRHYSNRPWRKLFEKQIEYRNYCSPVLDGLKLPPLKHPHQQAFLEVWPTLDGSKTERIAQAAEKLPVAKGTIYRYLQEFFPKQDLLRIST